MIKINQDDVIIEEFWDPVLSELNEYQIQTSEQRGLFMRQFWCWVEGIWKRSRDPNIGKLVRNTNLQIGDYTSMIVCASIPNYVQFEVIIENQDSERLNIIQAP